jgi:hypothetical protein
LENSSRGTARLHGHETDPERADRDRPLLRLHPRRARHATGARCDDCVERTSQRIRSFTRLGVV